MSNTPYVLTRARHGSRKHVQVNACHAVPVRPVALTSRPVRSILNANEGDAERAPRGPTPFASMVASQLRAHDSVM
jgi:hypothetical protein